MKHGVIPLQFLGGIDGLIVRIDLQPRFSCRKPGAVRIVPLHRRPCVVTARPAHDFHRFFPGQKPVCHMLTHISQGLDIVDLIQALPRAVRHTQLLPLIDIGGALHHMQAGRQHFRASLPVLAAVTAPAGDAARLVMVLKIKGIPCFSFELILPFCEIGLKVRKAQLPEPIAPAHGIVIQSHVLKLEAHIQLFARK